MKTIVKDALVLFLITLVAGLLLGFVYEVTKEPRAKQAEIKRVNAFKAVFTDYFGDKEKYDDINLENLVFEDYDLNKLKNLEKTLKDNGYGGKVVIDEVVAALADSKLIGYAVTVTSKIGYGGDIQLTVGYTLDGTVTGLSYLSIAETPGLGMEAKEKEFTDNFVGKSGGNFIVNKDNVAGLANEIDAISSATITSRAVTSAVNGSYLTVMEILEGGDINE